MISTIRNIFLAIFFAFLPLSFARAADVSITEIMYDAPGTDADHEWIEIHNSGGSAVDLTNWKFFEEGTNHGLAAGVGGMNLPSDEYAIIASSPSAFQSDFPSFSGMIIDSSWSSFNNSGETLSLKDSAGNIVHSVTYTGGSQALGDGNTLQYVSGDWKAGPPTPGQDNEEGAAPVTDSDTADPAEDEEEAIPLVRKSITVDIIPDGLAIVGKEITFTPTIIGLEGEEIISGFMRWTYGDGGSFETKRALPVTHTYRYPGTYVVYLDYSKNFFELDTKPITDKIILTVLEPSVIISKIYPDGAIELKNDSDKDRDLSFWIFKLPDGREVTLPKRTTILSGKSLIISPEMTGFSGGLSNVELLIPGRKLAAKYPSFQEAKTSYSVVKTGSSNSSLKNSKTVSSTESAANEELEVADANILLASVATADVVGDGEKKTSTNWLYVGAFVILSGGFLFGMRKLLKGPSTKSAADEYTILSS